MTGSDTVVIIGGSSGLGLSVARRCLADGASVVLAGRSQERLDTASPDLGTGKVTAIAADIGDQTQVARLFERVGFLRHLVVTAADLPYGAAVTLTEEHMMRGIRSKVLGPLFAAHQAAERIRAGSITFTSGVAAYRPMPGGAIAATVNSALEVHGPGAGT